MLIAGQEALIAPMLESDFVSSVITDIPSRIVAALRIADTENLSAIRLILVRLCDQLSGPDYLREAIRTGLDLLAADTLDVTRNRLLRFLAGAYGADIAR